MLGNRCLDHTEKPPSRPTYYVIRHILHVSRPNSNVGSEWRKSTRIIDRISQRSNRQDQSAEESHTYPNEPNSSLQMLITAVKIYKIIQLFGDSAVPHRDLSNYVG